MTDGRIQTPRDSHHWLPPSTPTLCFRCNQGHGAASNDYVSLVASVLWWFLRLPCFLMMWTALRRLMGVLQNVWILLILSSWLYLIMGFCGECYKVAILDILAIMLVIPDVHACQGQHCVQYWKTGNQGFTTGEISLAHTFALSCFFLTLIFKN